jgi:hypothetical protein
METEPFETGWPLIIDVYIQYFIPHSLLQEVISSDLKEAILKYI